MHRIPNSSDCIGKVYESILCTETKCTIPSSAAGRHIAVANAFHSFPLNASTILMLPINEIPRRVLAVIANAANIAHAVVSDAVPIETESIFSVRSITSP